MAWIDKKQRSDGGISARVVWRLGGSRDGAYQSETFSAGTDAVNMERARGFKSMVDAAGQHWPEGWVRGEGFVRPSGGDPMRPPPCFHELGEEYVRQIVDLSPGQRKRYLGQLRVLAVTRVQGELVFTKPVTSITEAECEAAVRLAGPYGDLITVAVGAGLRFGEITALWVSDVDLTPPHDPGQQGLEAWGRSRSARHPGVAHQVAHTQARDARALSGQPEDGELVGRSRSRSRWRPRCPGSWWEGRPTTSSSPRATAGLCTAATSTPTSGAS